MDLFKNLFGIFRSDEPRQEDNGNDLRRQYIQEPTPDTGPSDRSRNEIDIPKEFINKFFNGKSSENDQASRFESDSSFPFPSLFSINPFELEKHFEKMMEEMEMQFQGIMWPHRHIFENEDNLRDNHLYDEGHNHENEKLDESEMLRRKYLIDPDEDYNPSKKKDISLDGKISPDDILQLVKRRSPESNELMPQINIKSRMSSVVITVGPDGMAEITKIEKSGDGKEEKTVTRMQLRK